MAINSERLYENACEALRRACVAVHDKDEDAGNKLYGMMVKDPELYLRASDRHLWNDALPALEIYIMAKASWAKQRAARRTPRSSGLSSALAIAVKICRASGRTARGVPASVTAIFPSA